MSVRKTNYEIPEVVVVYMANRIWPTALTMKVIVLLAILKVSVEKSVHSPNGYIYPPPDEVWPGTESVYFGLMMSFGGSQKSSGVVPGVEVALDFINNKSKSSILPRHTLHYILYDSQCNRTTALDGFFSLVHGSGDPAALIGSGCSKATKTTAEIAHYFNVTQISCTSSAYELFENYFQILPSEQAIAKVFFSIIHQYKWRKVAFIIQNEQGYQHTFDEVKRLLSRHEPSRNYSIHVFRDTSIVSLRNMDLFESGYRITVLLVSAKLARQLICKAHLLNMKYPRYLFLTYGNSYGPDWWVPPDNEDVNHECTPEDRVRVLQYSLSANYFQFQHHTAMDGQMISDEYLELYNDRLDASPFNLSSDSYSHFCFDATWTLALALNNINESLRSAAFHQELKKRLHMTDYHGFSGDIAFDSNGIRHQGMELSVSQYRTSEADDLMIRLEAVKIADTDDCVFTYLSGENDTTVWREFGVPYDGTSRIQFVSIHPALSAIFVPLSLLGIMFTVVCLIFTVIFRRKKIIRLTSPNLSYLICTGCILIFIGCAVLFIPPTTSFTAAGPLCMVNLTTVAIGYSLAFGSVVAKIGRVYMIFRYPKKITIRDWHLIVFVLTVTSLPLLILLCYIIYEGVVNKYQAIVERNTEYPSSLEGVIQKEVRYYVYTCTVNKTSRLVVVVLIYLYIVVFTVAALVLAFLTRKVKVTALNESKQVAAIVYLTSIVLIITALCSFTIRNHVNLYPLISGGSTIVAGSAHVLLIFIPKMILLYKNPQGEGIFSVEEPSPPSLKTTDQLANEAEELKKKVYKLEQALAHFKKTAP